MTAKKEYFSIHTCDRTNMPAKGKIYASNLTLQKHFQKHTSQNKDYVSGH